MSTMTTAQFADLITPGVRALFFEEMGMTPDIVSQIYGVENSEQAYEKYKGVSNLGLVEEKGQGEASRFDRMNPEYLTTFTHKSYSQTLSITREMLDDQNMVEINGIATGMGEAIARTKQYHGALTFINAFSTSYLQADGKALCVTDHPLGASNTTAHSNKGTSELSPASLSATRIAMRKFLDQRGNPMMVRGDTLIVPSDLELLAREITESDRKAGTANNDANVSLGTNVIVVDWLTDTNNWFLIDSRRAKRFLKWFNRVDTELDQEYEMRTATQYLTSYARWSYGSADWRWVYGHEVA